MAMLIQCTDKAGMLQTRLDTRDTHLGYLDSKKDIILAGGAVMDAEGKPFGSVLIIDTDDEAVARDFAENDPFNKAGLFETVTVTAWRKAFFNFENLI